LQIAAGGIERIHVPIVHLGSRSKVKPPYHRAMANGLRVGEVASETGVSTATIRHYERLGLLPRAQRTASGYRVYPHGAIGRVRLVRSAVRFGFTLRELVGFLQVRDRGGAPCRDVRRAGQRILEAADRELAALSVARDAIAHALGDWDRRLAKGPEGQPARLLEDLPDLPERATRPRRGRSRFGG
jgi:DNA-binding transcriptional MerR regulator